MSVEAWSLVGGMAGAVTGVVALAVSVYFTRRATRAAESAAASAQRTSHIEVQRRHAELTPQIALSATADVHGRVSLTLTLEGPPGVHLDEVAVSISDDQPEPPRTGHHADNTVWGPYRFVPGANQRLGASAEAFALRRGEQRTLELEPSVPPAWIDPSAWADRYGDTPIRLDIRCTRDDHEPWVTLMQVDQPQAVFDVAGRRTPHGTLLLTLTNRGNAPARDITIEDEQGGEPPLDGDMPEVIQPGDVLPQVAIMSGYQWVKLTWTDPRSSRQSLTVRG